MARFTWTIGNRTGVLALPRPMKFRDGSLVRARSRYRTVGLDQRTVVTELLGSGGADLVEGRIRYIGDPSLLAAMIEDAADGALLTYEHDNGISVSDLLLEGVGPLTSIQPDASRFGFGEWERTLRLRHVGDGSANLLASPEAFDDTGAWTNTATVTADTDVAPDQTQTADDVNDDSTVAQEEALQSGIPYSSGDKIFASMFIKKNIGGATLLMGHTFSGTDPSGSTNHRLNPENGLTTFNTIGVELDRGVVDLGNYWLLWHAVQDNAAHDTVFFRFRPAMDHPGSFGTDSTATGSQVVWGAQLVVLPSTWTAGDPIPAYVPVSRRVLWQLFPPVSVT